MSQGKVARFCPSVWDSQPSNAMRRDVGFRFGSGAGAKIQDRVTGRKNNGAATFSAGGDFAWRLKLFLSLYMYLAAA